MINDEELLETICTWTSRFKAEDLKPYYMDDPGLPATNRFWESVLANSFPKNGSFYTSETFTCFWCDHEDALLTNTLTQKEKETFLLISLLDFYYDDDLFDERFGYFLENLIDLNIKTLKPALKKYCDSEQVEALVMYVYESFLGEDPDFNKVVENSDTHCGTLIFTEYPGIAWIRLMERFFPKNNEFANYIISEIKKYKF